MLGWQDGLTSGMARCRECGRTYHFDLVAWDEDQDWRLYGFKEVTAASYQAVVTLLTAGSPAPERAREHIDLVTLRVRDALATSHERKLLVLARDLEKSIESARMVEFEEWTRLMRA